MPRHETDIELRAIIISLKKTGNFTISQISRITNRPPSTISTITGRYQRYGTLNNSIRSGRPKNLNARQERHLLLLARKHRFASARQLLSWASLSGRISADTASRIFRRNNLTSRRPRLKPFLKPGHRTARLQWAQERKDWATDEWKRFCFTDESTFEVGKPNRSQRVHRYPGEQYNDNCLVPSFKSGRTSTSFWGAIDWYGTGQLICIRGEGRMTE